jgi:actin-related protein 2
MAAGGEKAPIVSDNGTGFVKCGFAGTNFPSHIFPSMVGTPQMRYDEEFLDIELKDIMVGDEAARYRSMLEIRYPVEQGQVKNWDDMCHIWDYTFFDRLKVDPSEHKIMLTEPPMNPQSNKMKMCENMLEKYGFQAVKIGIQATLVLYAQGLLTGVSFDAGDGVSHIVPVFEGVCPQHWIARLNIAGRHITDHLIKLLQIRGYNFNKSADSETVRQIKESLCYVGYDLAVETQLSQETTVLTAKYTLPDTREIILGEERFAAPEIMFQPSLAGIESMQGGVHQLLYDTVQKKVDMDLRAPMWQHIVLSGGSTMFPGFPSRLEKEVKDMYLANQCKGDEKLLAKFKLAIEDPPRRKHMVYLGGAVLSDIMKDKNEFWITKQEWEEEGGDRVDAKGREMRLLNGLLKNK